MVSFPWDQGLASENFQKQAFLDIRLKIPFPNKTGTNMEPANREEINQKVINNVLDGKSSM